MSATVRKLGVAATACATACLALGQATPAQAVPSGVGTGWSVVGTVKHTSNPDKSGPVTLKLVSPSGTQYSLPNATFPSNSAVMAVSQTGSRVAVIDGSNHLRIYDASKGTSTTLPSSISRVSFTKPSGANLLAIDTSRSDFEPVYRADLSGHRLVTFNQALGGDYVQTADGTKVIGADKLGRITVNDNATGRIDRSLPLPAGYTKCIPTQMADSTHVTVRCEQASSHNYFRVFKYGITPGSKAQLVTLTTYNSAMGMGFGDAWQSDKGLVVASVMGCGAPRVGLVVNGKVKYFAGGDNQDVMTVIGDKAYTLNGSGCGEASYSEVQLRIPEGTVARTLAGSSRNPGVDVTSAVVIDYRR